MKDKQSMHTMTNRHYRSLVPRWLTKPQPCVEGNLPVRLKSQLQRKELHVSVRRLDKAEWPQFNKSAFDDFRTKPFPGQGTSSKSATLSEKAKEIATNAGRTIQQTVTNLASSTTQAPGSSSSASKSLSNMASHAATKANDSARNLKTKIGQSTNNEVLKAADSGRAMVSKGTESAPKLMSSAVQFMKNKSTTLLQSAGNFVMSAAQKSFLRLGQGLQQALKKGSSRVASSARAQVQPMIEYVENSGGSVVRKFWLWSLAAVGVYGVATTVPKEMIRVAFESRKTKEENRE